MSDFNALIDKFAAAELASREVHEHWDRALDRLDAPPIDGGGILVNPAEVLSALRIARAELDAAIAKMESAKWPNRDDREMLRHAYQAARNATNGTGHNANSRGQS